VSGVGEKGLQQFEPARRSVLDRADRTGQGTRIAGANLINRGLEALAQAVSV
jgi:hypothetical protein